MFGVWCSSDFSSIKLFYGKSTNDLLLSFLQNEKFSILSSKYSILFSSYLAFPLGVHTIYLLIFVGHFRTTIVYRLWDSILFENIIQIWSAHCSTQTPSANYYYSFTTESERLIIIWRMNERLSYWRSTSFSNTKIFGTHIERTSFQVCVTMTKTVNRPLGYWCIHDQEFECEEKEFCVNEKKKAK